MKKLVVLLAAIAMVFAFTAQAMSDMDAYGSIRFRTYTVSTDKEFKIPNAPHDTTGTVWNMGTLTRLGFNFTSGDVGGKWEIDTGAGSVGTASRYADTDSNRWGDIRVRHAYGYWNFGEGRQLLIGQTFPLVDLTISNAAYPGCAMKKAGEIGLITARPMQLRLTFNDLKLALITPYTTGGYVTSATATDVTIPKIEISYLLSLGNVKLDFVGGYQSYDERVVLTDDTEGIDSWIVGVRAKANFDALYVGAIAGYAQNARQYGMKYTDNVKGTAYLDGTSIQNANTMNFGLTLGYKTSDKLNFQGGYFMTDTKGDDVGPLKYEDSSNAYFVQAKYKMASGVYMIPEIIVYNTDDETWGAATATEGGTQTAAGIFWMINFK